MLMYLLVLLAKPQTIEEIFNGVHGHGALSLTSLRLLVAPSYQRL